MAAALHKCSQKRTHTVKLITVANRLPVTFRDNAIIRSDGGLVSALEGVRRDNELIWVGWPGGDVPQEGRDAMIKTLREDLGCEPVFLSAEEREGYYDGFSNASLWPILHYMPDYMEYKDEWFDAYWQVNRKFADTVLRVAQDGDIVWVQDYHLFLLPEMLAEANPTLRIGFFLHTPFPSYELFRCQPRRQELLRGVLGAQLVGFHTFGYLRHFRSSLQRILNVDSNLNQVLWGDHRARLGVFPIGIDSHGFGKLVKSDEVARFRTEIDAQYADRRMVLSVERLDYSKGIPKKLQAIERFLELYPELVDSINFVLIAVPSREEVDTYRDLKESVAQSVGHINGRFATVRNIPVNFINRSVPFAELVALYSRADMALVTPLVDGMNLVAKEYLACRENGDGVLLLSEFAGAAQELFSAVLVNPYDIDGVSRAIADGLQMHIDEQRERVLPMRQRILEYNADRWTEDFLAHLDASSDDQQATAGYQSARREVLAALQPPGTSLHLFLDYDGTLREFERNPLDAVPTAEMRDLFRQLDACADCHVFIVSGRSQSFLDAHFGDYRFGLVAEHGYWVRLPGADWTLLKNDADLSWKAQIMPIFQFHALSTPGSSVEEKRSALVWHYRKADPEFGAWKANHLIGELTESISNLPVEIHHGKCIVEVNSQHISKGIAVERAMKQVPPGGVAVCIGDDQTDESMLQLRFDNFFPIKVGEGATAATYRIPSPKKVRAFLSDLIAAAKAP
jgi:trehalose 6-phosphate synthase/phosphatase